MDDDAAFWQWCLRSLREEADPEVAVTVLSSMAFVVTAEMLRRGHELASLQWICEDVPDRDEWLRLGAFAEVSA